MERGMVSVDQWSGGSQAYFLTHLHADHTVGLSPTWKQGPLFCSRTTAKLFPVKFPGFNLSLLRVLEIGHWHSLSLASPSTGSDTTLQVMAIDADHCPGAVMYLFYGEFGCMLYTGDFCWETTSKRAQIGKSMLLNAIGLKKVDILYLDNTYCNPSYCFPSREIAAQQIWVWPERLQIMHLLGFHDIFTTNTSLTRVRAVPRYSFSIDTLEGLNTMHPTIGIMPSGLSWKLKPLEGKSSFFGSGPSNLHHSRSKLCTKSGSQSDKLKLSESFSSVEKYHEYIYAVPYSDHSCFDEIKKFVKLVQPSKLRGIVSSSPSYVSPLYHLGRLLQPNQTSQALHRNFEKRGDNRFEAVIAGFAPGSGNSAAARTKRRRKRELLRVRLSRVKILRRLGCGTKILELADSNS
ncbi:uncharacterized protein LOC127812256 isoform X2 [Diospyros lotus]|uniref:uncharacterized protein LOC127812256 isoform X2 n=1 Tax=Diospyros lotus TaxID=55363 RepID=UPI00224E1BEF|nr:uncharacterized protein LOC127812256 isoform X2 [Diospyros lotus]